MLFIFAASASCIASTDPAYSFRGLLSLLDAFLLYVMAQDAPQTKTFWKSFGWITLASIGLVGLDVVSQKFSGTGWISATPLKSEFQFAASGSYSSPNNLIIFAVYLPCIFLIPWNSFTGKALLKKTTLLALVGVSLFGALLSRSRNVWFATGLFVLIAGWVIYRWEGLLLSLALMLTMTFALPQGRETLDRALHAQYNDRVWIWKTAFGIWEQRPVLGVGPRIYPRIHSNSEGVVLPERVMYEHHPHSLYLETLVETGLIGLVTLLTLIGYSVYALWKSSQQAAMKSCVIFLSVALGLLLISGLADFSMRFRFFSYTLFFFCGLAHSYSHNRHEELVNSRETTAAVRA